MYTATLNKKKETQASLQIPIGVSLSKPSAV